MHTEITKIDSTGRILIPSAIRKQNDLNPGDLMVIAQNEDGTLNLMSRIESLRRGQEMYARDTKGKGTSVDDFIAERRAEAAKED